MPPSLRVIKNKSQKRTKARDHLRPHLNKSQHELLDSILTDHIQEILQSEIESIYLLKSAELEPSKFYNLLDQLYAKKEDLGLVRSLKVINSLCFDSNYKRGIESSSNEILVPFLTHCFGAMGDVPPPEPVREYIKEKLKTVISRNPEKKQSTPPKRFGVEKDYRWRIDAELPEGDILPSYVRKKIPESKQKIEEAIKEINQANFKLTLIEHCSHEQREVVKFLIDSTIEESKDHAKKTLLHYCAMERLIKISKSDELAFLRTKEQQEKLSFICQNIAIIEKKHKTDMKIIGKILRPSIPIRKLLNIFLLEESKITKVLEHTTLSMAILLNQEILKKVLSKIKKEGPSFDSGIEKYLHQLEPEDLERSEDEIIKKLRALRSAASSSEKTVFFQRSTRGTDDRHAKSKAHQPGTWI